ncbi:MAG: ATP-binding protein [Cyanobacteria bacterium]|nr:ATP-binding protein [Cyanobacteriota bacterium]MDA1021296.1 ATP-binding protein [Cyanobacteriota bacterium]
MLVKRAVLAKLTQSLDRKEIYILLGARQVGKSTLMTTLAKQTGQSYRFLNLEDPRDLAVFNDGYTSFIKEVKEDLIFIDEFHYYPNITSVFKALYDLNPEKKIYASGSSSLEIHKHLQESLAGRNINLKIYPLSFNEYLERFGLMLPEIEEHIEIKQRDELKNKLEDFIRYGAMPGLIELQDQDDFELVASEKLYSIYQTYISKDIKTFLKDESIINFNKLIEYFAINDTQMLSIGSVANKLKLPESQIRKQLEVMTETYTLNLLKPFFKNKNKEISKSPKAYFYDQGIANAILQDFKILNKRNEQSQGALLESFVYWELIKSIDVRFKLNYWRSYDEQEVDFILQKDGEILPIEVKKDTDKIPSGLKAFIRDYPQTKQAVVLTLEGEDMVDIKYKDTVVRFFNVVKAGKLKSLLY